jgi:hypothetical protein
LKGRYQTPSRKLTKPQWQGKVLKIDRVWHGSTYALNIWNSWGAAAIRSSPAMKRRWHVDAAKSKVKIGEHCRWQELTAVIQSTTREAE